MTLDETVKNERYTGFTSAGKKQLCDALGWSRARFDRRLAADGNFPVLQRDNQGDGWSFDIAMVIRHLAAVLAVHSLGRKSDRECASAARSSAQQLRAQLAQIRAVRRKLDALLDELGTTLDRLAPSLGHVGLAAAAGERGEDGATR